MQTEIKGKIFSISMSRGSILQYLSVLGLPSKCYLEELRKICCFDIFYGVIAGNKRQDLYRTIDVCIYRIKIFLLFGSYKLKPRLTFVAIFLIHYLNPFLLVFPESSCAFLELSRQKSSSSWRKTTVFFLLSLSARSPRHFNDKFDSITI